MKFAVSSAVLLAVAVALVRGDIATVKSDVSAIDAAVTDLNNQLKSDDINYFSALGIHSSAMNLDGKIQTATKDTNATTDAISDADAQSIIDTLTGTEKNVKSATDRLVVLKPKFDSLGVTGLAKGDVDSLATDTHAFGQALVGKAPADKKDAATAL